MSKLLDWLSYPRALIVAIFGLVHTFIMSFVVLGTAALTQPRRRPVDIAINWFWSWPLLWATGTSVEVRGAEHVSAEKKGFLILFNHSSLFDIPVLYCNFPRSFRFGAKIELFKIPVFGKAMEWSGVLPIDRHNRGKVMQVYQNAIDRVNKGEAFALAPEGTRQKQPTLGKFKRGPFEFAINAQMDIVPVIMAGAYDVLPKTSILPGAGSWRHRVILQILPRVPTVGIPMEKVEELRDRVRDMMDPVYQSLNRELESRV